MWFSIQHLFVPIIYGCTKIYQLILLQILIKAQDYFFYTNLQDICGGGVDARIVFVDPFYALQLIFEDASVGSTQLPIQIAH